ncbi:MAG TPA: glycosyltransferase family 4 protein [Burkholderiales bacterium]|jgi:UDP-glucose:(heptosyl)LPS alpha-1,3-glucosyltransferase|nr:glycosyltransferase family 4 protein [Burkholderiales bacterium]
MRLAGRTTRKKFKIAVVVPKYGLVGGGERFVSEITRRLARNNEFEIHVFANQWYAETDAITFHKVPNVRFPRFLRPLCFAVFAQWMIDRADFDLVHSHDRIFRADVFSLHSVPHRGWVRDVRKKRPSLFDRAIITIEHRMIAAGESSWFLPVSSVAKNAFCREYTTLPGQWQIAHPGVDVLRFATPDRAACRAEIRARHGIGLTDFLVLFVGMNFEVKGLDSIIAAVAKARRARPEANIRLLVVGRGNEGKFARIAQSFGIAEAVTFAGKQVDGIERYYRAADIFIMLSAFDTFGLVVLEAMAAGLPVIVSTNVGAKDLVDEGVNGFVLANEHDADCAADRIAQLLDAGGREAMGAAATRTATDHDWERLAKTISRIYESKLHSRMAV